MCLRIIWEIRLLRISEWVFRGEKNWLHADSSGRWSGWPLSLSGWDSRSEAEFELSEEHAKQESQPVDGGRNSRESSGQAGTWDSSAFAWHAMPRARTMRKSRVDNVSSGTRHVQRSGQRKQGPEMVPNSQREWWETKGRVIDTQGEDNSSERYPAVPSTSRVNRNQVEGCMH